MSGLEQMRDEFPRFCGNLPAEAARMNARVIALAASLWTGLASPVVAAVDEGAERACARLVDAARDRRWVAGDGRGEYLCELQEDAAVRYVFALRWRGEGLPEIGSNLIGFYLVDVASGAIHAWDLGEDRRGEVLLGAPVDAQCEPRACDIDPCAALAPDERNSAPAESLMGDTNR